MTLIPDHWYSLDMLSTADFALEFAVSKAAYLYKVGAVGLNQDGHFSDANHVVCSGEQENMPGLQLDTLVSELIIADVKALEEAGIYQVFFFMFSRQLEHIAPIFIKFHNLANPKESLVFTPDADTFSRRQPFLVTAVLCYDIELGSWKLRFQHTSYPSSAFYSLIKANGLGGTAFSPQEGTTLSAPIIQEEHQVLQTDVEEVKPNPVVHHDIKEPEPLEPRPLHNKEDDVSTVISEQIERPSEEVSTDDTNKREEPEAVPSEAVALNVSVPPPIPNRWDCDECVVSHLSVTQHRYCPACGNLHKPSLSYVADASDAPEVAFLDEKKECKGCLSRNAPSALYCRTCGSSLHSQQKKSSVRRARAGESVQVPYALFSPKTLILRTPLESQHVRLFKHTEDGVEHCADIEATNQGQLSLKTSIEFSNIYRLDYVPKEPSSS